MGIKNWPSEFFSMQLTVSATLSNGLISKAEFILILQHALERNYRATGAALRQIKSIGSWKHEGFDNYAEYCLQVWGITEQRANNLVQCWSLCKLLVMNGIDEEDLPVNEETALCLLKVTGQGDICEFWKGLLEHHSAGAITPRLICKALKIQIGTYATINNPAHPHHGLPVQIQKRTGETVTVFGPAGIHGRQILLSAELHPCLPPELEPELATAR